MRKILFRGFTPDKNGREKVFVNGEWIKGQWVQGSYMTLDKTTYCFKEDYEANPDNTEHYIVFDQMVDWGLPNRHLQADVIPETVGQFAGRTDKNGKRIFEGDIVTGLFLFALPVKAVVTFQDGAFGLEWYRGGDLRAFNAFTSICNVEYEVIGNIHDNPELLKNE
jgi:uncharacterized phage protein (TIGR01671 family)